jgi:uncharacterized protein YjbI with pentapeptide repeats
MNPQPRPQIPDHLLAAQKLWNDSRQQRGQAVELIYQDLEGIDLSGLDLTDACFAGSNLKLARAVATSLAYGHLQLANFENANLSLANLAKARLNNAVFDHATLIGANLAKANAIQTSFKRADLRGANLAGMRAHQHTSFAGADLRDADLEDIRMSEVDFTDVDLRGAKGIDTIRWAENIIVGDQVLSGAAFITWAQQEAARP